MGSYSCGVNRRLVVVGIWDTEVGQGGDAGRRRVSDRCCGDRVWLWGGDGLVWRGLRGLGFEICVRKPQGADNGCCGRVRQVRASWFWLPGLEYRWRGETLPAAIP